MFQLPFYLRSPNCSALGPYFPCSPQDVDGCTSGAVCDPTVEFCTNVNEGGGCGGTGLGRVVVGAFLGGYIILYGQVQSWTPQLVTNPLQQTPPNKMTEVFWGGFNCYPTLIAAIVVYASETFINYNLAGMITWLIVIIVSFAIIFAINSSIHSFLVVKYAKSDTVAKSVGFYYMSNAVGRLVGTLGSGFLYTYAGGQVETLGGYAAGNDARLGLAACFVAGTISSLLAAVITIWIKDEDAGKCLSCCGCGILSVLVPTNSLSHSLLTGLKCGRCLTIIAPKATSSQQQPQEVTETQRSALSA